MPEPTKASTGQWFTSNNAPVTKSKHCCCLDFSIAACPGVMESTNSTMETKLHRIVLQQSFLRPRFFSVQGTQQTTYKKICEYLAPGDKLQFTCTDAENFQFHKIHWFSHNRPTFQQGGNQNQELKNLSVLYNFKGPLNTTNKYAFFPGLICVLSLVHIGK